MTRRPVIQCRLDEGQHVALHALSAALRVPAAELVREVLDVGLRWLDEGQGTLDERMQALRHAFGVKCPPDCPVCRERHTCGLCGKTGHNRRTCEQANQAS